MDKPVSEVLARVRLIRRSHALAVALNRSLSTQIVLVVDDGNTIRNPYTRDAIPQVIHVLARLADGGFVDGDGSHDQQSIEGRFLRRNDGSGQYRMITLNDELALQAFVSHDWDYVLSPLSDDEIGAALLEVDLPQGPDRKDGST